MARDYTKIKAWQLADELALLAYKAANRVEGSARRNRKEYLQFLYIAMSSLAELSYYVKFTKELGYLDSNRYEEWWGRIQEGLRTLQGLISCIEKSGV